MSESERAVVRKTDADTDAAYIASGVVSPDEVRARVNDDPSSHWHNRDLSAAAPEQDGDAAQLAGLTDDSN